MPALLTYFELTRAHGLSPFRAARRTKAPGGGAHLMRTGLLCIAAGLLTGSLGGGRPTPLWLNAGSCALTGCGLGLANGAAMTTVAMGTSGATGATGTPPHLALCSAAPALALTAVALTRRGGGLAPLLPSGVRALTLSASGRAKRSPRGWDDRWGWPGIPPDRATALRF
ncbi:hypothetical protein EKH77_30750 [Streptomyces luteoverticillatus]|uniref:Uncharacterized protein n=1 Tax=Streptomyces luteoverticillatus TaxID=66425 RepID=A0A3Q9FYR7_STRLT|nr:hypothetical protein [Streptomyces luteoverticillatus]AZQ74969.1 hypothetical protein EKH77_30750 [Streptomyces luteoverticillatus]